MTPLRLPDWEQRLAAWLEDVRDRPFQWGRHDCALFMAGAVLAMTGQDFGEPFRGRYRSAAGAARALRRWGSGDLPSTLSAALGPAVPLALAQRGDVVMVEGACGLLMGRRALFAGDAGLVRRERTELEPISWHVPFEGER